MVIFNEVPFRRSRPAIHGRWVALWKCREAIGALTEVASSWATRSALTSGIAHGYATLGTLSIGFEGRLTMRLSAPFQRGLSPRYDEAKPVRIFDQPRYC